MTSAITKERVLEELKRIKGPDLEQDIVSLGLVSEVVIHNGKVYFAISVDPARAGELETLRQAAEQVVRALPGVEGVVATLTADRKLARPAGGNGGAQSSPPPPGGVTRPGAAGAGHQRGLRYRHCHRRLAARRFSRATPHNHASG